MSGRTIEQLILSASRLKGDQIAWMNTLADIRALPCAPAQRPEKS